MAEIANEEYGRHVLPGLHPILQPEREEITKENVLKRADYDSKTNTMFLQFRGLQIKTQKDIINLRDGLQDAFQSAKSPSGKVHVVVDYENCLIADDIFAAYWQMVADLEHDYYLSAKRFHVTSFGTGSSALPGDATGMRVASNWSPDTKHSQHISEEAAAPRSGRSLKLESGDYST